MAATVSGNQYVLAGQVSAGLEILRAPAAREILSPLVLEFLRRYPQVHIDLVTEGRLVDIVAEGFDLGVRINLKQVVIVDGWLERHPAYLSAEWAGSQYGTTLFAVRPAPAPRR